MRIKVLRDVLILDHSYPPGFAVDVDETIARRLVQAGHAIVDESEPFDETPPASTPEAAEDPAKSARKPK